ncbi:MAG: D-alanyl-D-alanine carboxypeptidase [Parcubacteria group bacterium Gr01-1014_29]|nr:MAG: D-alanyl-D-alanine carboxypeptidase [Parcubacteria group bacterium Gr01-1014_29]
MSYGEISQKELKKYWKTKHNNAMAFTQKNILVTCVLLLGSMMLFIPVSPHLFPSQQPPLYATLLESLRPLAEISSGQESLPSPLEDPELVEGLPDLVASAALAYNPVTKHVSFQKNADAVFGIASITKIMTALVALEHVGKDDIVRVSTDAIGTEGAEGDLMVEEHFTLQDLIALMMTGSSNDAAAALAEHIGSLYGAASFKESQDFFTGMMNEKAQVLGMHHTRYQNPTGLDRDEEAGILSNSSTARDLAILIEYTLQYYPAIWEANTQALSLTSQEGFVHHVATTHNLLESMPGIISGKTGFTDTAGGALITIADVPLGEKHSIIILGSTLPDRFSDTERLVEWLRK